MRKLSYFLAFALFAAGAPTLCGHEQGAAEAQKPDPKKVKELMHKKLTASQQLLEALVLNDLDKTAKSANELIQIRKDLTWKVVPTDQYEMWSNDFLRSAEKIVQATKDKNIESAKLNYLGMTLACFHCHTYVRDLRMTKAAADAPRP